MNAVMLSIRPQYCELIANGKKTIEVRKTRPKLETPFKCYIYCTIGGDALCPPHLNSSKWNIHRQGNGTTNGRKMTTAERDKSDYHFANGKVIGEFVCDRTIGWGVNPLTGLYDIFPNELAQTCISSKDFEDYGSGKRLYGWHISALQIYDKPKELSEFTKFGHDSQMPCCRINRPPQSWCYVEELL